MRSILNLILIMTLVASCSDNPQEINLDEGSRKKSQQASGERVRTFKKPTVLSESIESTLSFRKEKRLLEFKFDYLDPKDFRSNGDYTNRKIYLSSKIKSRGNLSFKKFVLSGVSKESREFSLYITCFDKDCSNWKGVIHKRLGEFKGQHLNIVREYKKAKYIGFNYSGVINYNKFPHEVITHNIMIEKVYPLKKSAYFEVFKTKLFNQMKLEVNLNAKYQISLPADAQVPNYQNAQALKIGFVRKSYFNKNDISPFNYVKYANGSINMSSGTNRIKGLYYDGYQLLINGIMCEGNERLDVKVDF